ncbi:hypothetical protein [Dactylosporangium matsuzakiense]|uniref:Uncharacterized protein n=1 Tax=Dactylosporangium matsuzakiense TaxID=53360 RepID=A0A9W6NPU0_9ACTN|nr:hypothetical protein [Dactylosporangium matsuzakiense]UWZ44653.1 hypothetical protein Dmats_46195 [Dactylosporangium matsuzakiense]GLL04663.1 hypothetical protein GCM10017581_064100 [Dactylosporangium matsuzakiense]
MSFHHATTLTDYARTAVDLRIRMTETAGGPVDEAYLRALLAGRFEAPDASGGEDPKTAVDGVVDTVICASRAAWSVGESFVLAPAMTAIVAAAGEALDLTGDLLTAEAAPCDHGVLFLPEPIYHRRPTGVVTAIGAITWASISVTNSGQRLWLICSYSPLDDPDDPAAASLRRNLARNQQVRAGLGPYLLNDIAELPIARPVPAPPDTAPVDERDLDWQSTPEGRYVITDDGHRTDVVACVLYAFWRIQAQPITVAAKTPADRPTRRRALRASIVHETRVVMLRRTSPATDPGDGEAKWHYRVRFFVRGHWRRLVDKQGRPYRVWVQAHIKGPGGAPLLLGEKVAVLAR